MSNYLENKLIDHLLRTSTFAKPAAVYVALYTVLATDAGGGTEVSTVGTGYARIQAGPSDAAWFASQGGTSGDSNGTGGLTENATEITFGTPTGNWGTVVGWALWDAVTAGNMLIHAALSISKTVNNGDAAPKFVAGALDITFG
jgi:hypothetical protein